MNAFVSGPHPSLDLLIRLREGVRQRLDCAKKSNENFVDRHNAYVDYCLVMLLTATAHRAVYDPFPSIDLFDLDARLLLINDKVCSEDRAWRLVSLPPIVAQQMQAYIEYLPKLAGRLDRDPRFYPIAAEVVRIPVGETSALPLFFYLSQDASWRSIRPGEMQDRWGTDWPLLVSTLRHVAATVLVQKGRADWAQIQLGHIDGVDHPFGGVSTKSPMAVLHQIGNELERFLVEHVGWSVASAPIHASALDRTEPETMTQRLSPVLLAHRRRSKTRDLRRGRAASMVAEVIREVLNERILADVGQDEFDALVDTLMRRAVEEGFSVDYCFRLLHRFLRRQEGNDSPLRRMSRIRFLEHEPSPFGERTLQDYRAVRRYRKAYVDRLDRSGHANYHPTACERMAEIAVSAVLFGGIVTEDRLRRLIQAIPNHSYQSQNRLFVDIPLAGADARPVYRWYPDPISAALLLGWHVQEKKTISFESVWGQITSLLSDHPESGSFSVLTLLSAAKTAAAIELPGYVAAVLRGDWPSVSVPLPQWVRITTGRVLGGLVTASADVPPETQFPHLNLSGARTTTSKGEGGRFLRTIRAAIRAASDIAPRGNIRRNRTQKKKFAKELVTRFERTSDWTPLALMLADWGIHLSLNGTRIKRNIAFSTVKEYLQAVARALYASQVPADFASLDDIQYDEVYLRAIDHTSDSRRGYLVGRLQSFHDHAVETLGLEDPDWSALYAAAGLSLDPTFSNANLLREDEYLRALRWQLNGGRRTSRVTAALMILGYRFGLRAGEALRVQYRDVQYHEDLSAVSIVVRDNVYGDVKSLAAIRVIPLLEHLSDEEQEVLKFVLAAGAECFDRDPLALLLGDPSGGERILLDRHAEISSIHHVLRSATGDPNIRYHHLRHTWASRVIGYLPLGPRQERLCMPALASQPNTTALREFLGAESAFPIRSISTALGHAHESTSIMTYIHVMDVIASAHLEPICMDLPDCAAAYALAVAPATMRSRRVRDPNRKPYLVARDRRLAQVIRSPDVETYSPADDCPLECMVAEGLGLTLRDTEWLLQRTGRGGQGIEAAAQHLRLPLEIAQCLLRHAAQLERRSGHVEYALEHRLPNDPILHSGHAVSPSPKSPSSASARKARCLIADLDARLSGTAPTVELISDLHVWADTWDPDRLTHYVTDLLELEVLRRYLAWVAPHAALRITIDAGSPRSEGLSSHIQQLGYRVEQGPVVCRLLSEKTELRRSACIQATLDVNRSTRRTLAQAAYIAGVWALTRSSF